MSEILDDAMLSTLEGFDLGEIIELFTVDATAIGGDVYRFAPAPVTNGEGQAAAPVFGGDAYAVIPFKSEGWEWSAGGPLPTPRLSFGLAREDGDQSSAVTALLALLTALDDLLGATVYRVRTLRKFLDDGEDPNPDAHMGLEVYTVARKAEQRPDLLTFELKSGLDHEGVSLPRRQALNRCQLIYRVPDGLGGFDYAKATCPYTGAAMFDLNGDPVLTAAEDKCGKLLRDCKARFGEAAELPFGGFPGVGRLAIA